MVPCVICAPLRYTDPGNDCAMDALMEQNKMADLDEAIQNALQNYNSKHDTDINQIKKLQRDVMQSILSNHTIGMLPTGYGKSLCYELLPDLIEHMFQQPTFVIVIVPLNVILSQQLDKLGTNTTCLSSERMKELTVQNSAERKRWIEGHYQFVFSHPEQIVGNIVVREILLDKYFQEKTRTFIVIDEAHCVLDWGREFRPVFAQLGCLRALLPCAQILALSATLLVESQAELAKKIGMTDHKSVSIPPARDNISLIMCKTPTESSVQQAVEIVLEPLLTELLVKGQSFPLTVVYFNGSQDWVGRSFELAERMLGEKMYSGGHELQHTRVVQFHASMEKNGDKIKTTILQNLAEDPSYSPLKIVLATVALGMGADLQHVQRVVNLGSPKRLENYIQQVGRAGRSGKQAEAALFFNNSDIGRPHVTKAMKSLCKNTTVCRRQQINEAFGFHTVSDISADICCDICNAELAKPYMYSSSSETKSLLLNILSDYISKDDTQYLSQKLSISAIQQIISAPEIFNRQILAEEFELDIEIAASVEEIINQVKVIL